LYYIHTTLQGSKRGEPLFTIGPYLGGDADIQHAGYLRLRLCYSFVLAASVKERRTMKKFLYNTAVACAFLVATAALNAQMPEQQGGGQWGPGQIPTADQRLQRMTQMLNLTDDQQQKIKPILENESSQMQSLRGDTSLSQEDRMAKMKEIRTNTASQINPILNADQQKKYAEMMSRMGRGRGQGGPPSGAPPQQ
jgi:Spy/CpxP family protein refolding chaperone